MNMRKKFDKIKGNLKQLSFFNIQFSIKNDGVKNRNLKELKIIDY